MRLAAMADATSGERMQVRCYWTDSCATFACGRPSALRRRHDAVRRALERGIKRARAGARASEVDTAMRDVLAEVRLECPHHTGHVVGARPQGMAWLAPADRTVLAAGKTLAGEPGCYANGQGVRLEHVLLVTEDGCEPLTTHSIELT
jgi:Xaa-Pro aminopeptidase